FRIGKVSPSSTNPILQIVRIRPAEKHLRIVVALQKQHVRMLDDMFDIVTSSSQIRHNTDIDLAVCNDKAARLLSVMILWNSQHGELSHLNTVIRLNEMNKVARQRKTRSLVGPSG